jgi:hypothetical protein
MGKQGSKEHFVWYAQVAEEKLKEMKKNLKIDIFKDCKSRKDFSNYVLNVFIAYYGLRCTCDDIQDWEFHKAGGHYHHCDLWQFCYLVDRCLDWSEEHYTKSAETELL